MTPMDAIWQSNPIAVLVVLAIYISNKISKIVDNMASYLLNGW